MKDHIIRATAEGVRVLVAVTTELVAEAAQKHQCYPVAAAALGRTLTGALLLAANLKNAESITLKIAGDGPLGVVVADASVNGLVRGYVENPQVQLPLKNGKLDVGQGIGKGQITVTRFTGLKQSFTGSSILLSGEIAEDITHYLMVSEQTASSVALGVMVQPDLSVSAAGGFFIEAMPGADDQVIQQIEKNLADLPPVSALISDQHDGKAIIQKLFQGLDYRIYDPEPAKFYCHCTRERVENMLLGLGKAELDEMIREGKAEVKCHFCNEAYQFDKQQLEEIAARIE